MILIDFSQLIISTSLDFFTKEKIPLELNLMRHIVLNTLLSLKQRLAEYSEEIILCVDSKDGYWRKDIFPEYKQHRKKEQAKSDFDWDGFFPMVDIIKEEFKLNLPYKTLEITKTEADDCIAVLCRTYGKERNIVIVSSDKDFLQLQTPDNKVKQYSNYHKEFLDNTDYNLFEHIVRGDSSDGLPNILSDDDTYLCENKRSKPIRKEKIALWQQQENNPEYFCESVDMLKRFYRNKQLVDLTQIPDDIQKQILDKYLITKGNGMKFFNYLVEHKLTKIMEKFS